MDPNIWGPKLWFFMHSIAINFPDNPSYQEIRNYEEFFNNLKFIIPCDKCKMHYKMYLEKNPVINHLKNADLLFNYTVKLHNDVNKRLNKKIYTNEEAIKIYTDIYNGKTYYKNYLKNIFSRNNIILAVLIIIICSVGVYYKKQHFYKIK